MDSVQTWRYGVDARQYGFFLAKRVRPFAAQDGERLYSDDEKTKEVQPERLRPQTPVTPGTPGINLGFSWAIGSLRSYEEGFFDGIDSDDRFICFSDPSTYETHPGWMLRNLLVLIRERWKLNNAQILCYRDTQARRHEGRSIILQIETDAADSAGSSDLPRITGWERNTSGKVTSKIANLGEYMDPQRCEGVCGNLLLSLLTKI